MPPRYIDIDERRHNHLLSMYYVPFARITTHMLLIMISAVKMPMGGPADVVDP